VIFFVQQFITWGTRADYGSYIVTTYKTSKLHEKKNRKGKKLRNKEETQKGKIKEKKNKRKPKRDAVNQTQLLNCIVKCKSTTVEF